MILVLLEILSTISFLPINTNVHRSQQFSECGEVSPEAHPPSPGKDGFFFMKQEKAQTKGPQDGSTSRPTKRPTGWQYISAHQNTYGKSKPSNDDPAAQALISLSSESFIGQGIGRASMVAHWTVDHLRIRRMLKVEQIYCLNYFGVAAEVVRVTVCCPAYCCTCRGQRPQPHQQRMCN